MELLLQVVRKHVDLSAAEMACFSSLFTHRQYKKNTVILKEGIVAKQFFFIVKGSLRQYFSSEKGIVKTCNLSFEGEFLTDLESFSSKTAAKTNIMTMEATECLIGSCVDLMDFMLQSVAITSFFNSIVEDIAVRNTERIRSLLSQSPEERFEALLKTNPEILQRVPQRYIAEYLGIAPESLSRIRKRIWTVAKS